ncbi:hypothetical protein GCK72_000175 [Caenorhabditis remanei]|uniref:F-box domain-containing protein n=1 Tax=Caenorhabditis remanei TaxID=31234 RepID=A0A6A5HQ26_CAERE|nr:hypothetical protein GCK72_000175 [Caenorhabditis remanei]KAF1768363.1 hypothetical protein GCK72_000175 [Caenorhabditis remanei]
MSEPFRIGKLPGVVLRKVFFNMTLFELINLSQCSNKTKSLINAWNIRHLELHVNLCYDYFVRVSEFVTSNRYLTKSQKFQCNTANPVTQYLDTELSVERVLTLIERINSVFKAEIKSLKITPNGLENQMRMIIDRILNIQKAIDSCKIVGDGTSAFPHRCEILRLKFREVNDQIDEYFDFFSMGGIPCDKLSIEHSSWFQISHLLDSTVCSKIQLKHSSFKSYDLNEFLREWVTGALPNLLFLSVKSRYCRDMQLVMEGLEEVQDTTDFRGRSHECFSGTEQHIINGKYIRRVDGAVATFNLRETSAFRDFFIFEFALLRVDI